MITFREPACKAARKSTERISREEAAVHFDELAMRAFLASTPTGNLTGTMYQRAAACMRGDLCEACATPKAVAQASTYAPAVEVAAALNPSSGDMLESFSWGSPRRFVRFDGDQIVVRCNDLKQRWLSRLPVDTRITRAEESAA